MALAGTAHRLNFFGFGQQRIDALIRYRASCLDMAATADRNRQPLLARECRAEAEAARRFAGGAA